MGYWTGTANATDGTSLEVGTTLSLHESFDVKLRRIMKTLMQVGWFYKQL